MKELLINETVHNTLRIEEETLREYFEQEDGEVTIDNLVNYLLNYYYTSDFVIDEDYLYTGDEQLLKELYLEYKKYD